MDHYYVYSRLKNNQYYIMNKKEFVQQINGRLYVPSDIHEHKILINGLESIATGRTWLNDMPIAITSISQEELNLLKSSPEFIKYKEIGYIDIKTVEAHQTEIELSKELNKQPELSSTKLPEILFANVGKKKQHKIDLIKVFKIPLPRDKKSLIGRLEAFVKVTFDKASRYLEEQGFEKPFHEYFFINDQKKIERWNRENQKKKLTLDQAIEELDGNKQSSRYIAAKIIHHLSILDLAMLNLSWNFRHMEPKKMMEEFFSIIHDVILIKEADFGFHLIEKIQPQYSAGAARAGKGAKEKIKNKEKWMNRAKSIYREYLDRHPKASKTEAAKYIKIELEKKFPEEKEKIPAANTLRKYF